MWHSMLVNTITHQVIVRHPQYLHSGLTTICSRLIIVETEILKMISLIFLRNPESNGLGVCAPQRHLYDLPTGMSHCRHSTNPQILPAVHSS